MTNIVFDSQLGH